jgi:hypothetical protein
VPLTQGEIDLLAVYLECRLVPPKQKVKHPQEPRAGRGWDESRKSARAAERPIKTGPVREHDMCRVLEAAPQIRKAAPAGVR